MNRTSTITRATKKPAPDSAPKTGLTCELCCLVVNGTVDGVTGRLPPIEGSVLAVVVGAGIVVLGVAVTAGRRVWVTGALVVAGAVAAVVGAGAVVSGVVATVVLPQGIGTQRAVVVVWFPTAPALPSGPAMAKPVTSAVAPASRIQSAEKTRRSIPDSVADRRRPGTAPPGSAGRRAAAPRSH